MKALLWPCKNWIGIILMESTFCCVVTAPRCPALMHLHVHWKDIAAVASADQSSPPAALGTIASWQIPSYVGMDVEDVGAEIGHAPLPSEHVPPARTHLPATHATFLEASHKKMQVPLVSCEQVAAQAQVNTKHMHTSAWTKGDSFGGEHASILPGDVCCLS